MAVLFTESFTGTDGAVWNASNWVLGRNASTGGSATIQGNAGRIASGTQGSYNGNDRVSRRANITNIADVDVYVSVRFDATESFPRLYVRANSTVDSGTGYAIVVDKGSWAVSKSVSYSGTDISPSMPFTYVQGNTYRMRLYALGSSIKAKFWLASGGEPSTWSWEGTDTSITAAGAVGLTSNSGAAASTVFFDDVLIQDAIANVVPTVNAGADATVKKGSVFSRTATASDSDGTISTYAWTVQSRPAGSVATPSGAATSTVSFTPDKVGSYTLRCTVTDNGGATAYDELILTVYGQGRRKKLRVAGAWQTKVVRIRQGGVWV